MRRGEGLELIALIVTVVGKDAVKAMLGMECISSHNNNTTTTIYHQRGVSGNTSALGAEYSVSFLLVVHTELCLIPRRDC